jgi:hypothetical protein
MRQPLTPEARRVFAHIVALLRAELATKRGK